MEKSKKKVLIVDDDKEMSDELKREFEEGYIAQNSGYSFEVWQVFDIGDLDEEIYGPRGYDVIIIDRKFGSEGQHKEKIVLWAVYSVLTDAVIIVWTAYPDRENIKECMQLGACDYLDKNNPRQGQSTFHDVVESAIEGLERKEFRKKKKKLDKEDEKWAEENESIKTQYKGKLIAIRNKKVQASGNNLIELLEDINRKGLDFLVLSIISVIR